MCELWPVAPLHGPGDQRGGCECLRGPVAKRDAPAHKGGRATQCDALRCGLEHHDQQTVAHRADERLDLEDLRRATKVIARSLSDLLS